jgi:putative aldouronate transport system substrate-binding protein
MKRSMSKKLSLLLSAVMCMTVLSACSGKPKEATQPQTTINNLNLTGYPIVKEPISIKAVAQVSPMNGDLNTMTMLKALNEKTGVNVAYEAIAQSNWEEKKNLILASNNLPDIFFGGGLSDTDISKYGKQGVFVKLEGLIDKYAPNVKKMLEKNPSVKKALTSPDGHIYTLPFFDEFLPENIPDNLFINKTWLNKLGLKVPTTTDEFYSVLKSFKENDPNGNGKQDEVPFTFRANQTFTGEFSMFGPFGVLDNLEHLFIKDGKLLFSSIQPEYKTGIKWMQKLYSEGLIDKEVFTQDQSQYVAKGKNKEMIVGAFIIYADENFAGVDRAYNDYVVVPPLKGPNGHNLWNRYNNGYYLDKFAITNLNKHPEATMRWVDEMFAEDLSMQIHWGELNKNLKLENGKYVIQPAPQGMSVDEFRFKNAPGPSAPGLMSRDSYEKLVFAIDKQKKIERYKLYDPYAVKQALPKIRFTEEQLNDLAVLRTDIDNYVKQMKAKWITGQSDIEKDWNGYIDQLKKMGVEKYVDIYQKGYELYK